MRNNEFFFDDWVGDTTDEFCPVCLHENEIKLDGKSSCLGCGHKNLFPCSACKVNSTEGWNLKCNWQNNPQRCNAFPVGEYIDMINEEVDADSYETYHIEEKK